MRHFYELSISCPRGRSRLPNFERLKEGRSRPADFERLKENRALNKSYNTPMNANTTKVNQRRHKALRVTML